MRDSDTVCAVVVTYNRKNLLLECLDAIRKQTRPVDAIYIIDNASTDGTPEVLKDNGYISELPVSNLSEPYEIEHHINNLVNGNPIKIFYVRMHRNTGSAGGFYEGVKRGYERGYDWLWLMDDDGLPEKDCLMNQLPSDRRIVTGPLVVDPETKLPGRGYEKFEKFPYNTKLRLFQVLFPITVAFNGFLVSREVIGDIGFPEAGLFYQSDDVEYSIRIIKRGYKIEKRKNAIFYHPVGKEYKYLSDLKKYFVIRNRIYILLKHYGFGLKLIKNIMTFLYLMFKGHIKPKVLFFALKDGLSSKLKNRYDLGSL